MAGKVGKRPVGADFRAEALRVRRWRQAQFADLGFSLADARRLANATADVGTARRLIAADCPLKTAFRILS